MKALSLYSGGCDGMSLAGSWLGIETTAYCDSEPACRAVLAARHPDAPIFSSDEDVTPDGLRAAGIDPATIDLVMGGPPCQCASVAGKRLGAADPRNRWPQYIRIVRELRPRWIMAENSPGLLSVDDGRLFGDILRGLAEAGYALCWDCWGAADVGAPHRRDRLFILGKLADPDRDGSDTRRAEPAGQQREAGVDGECETMADAQIQPARGLPNRARTENPGLGNGGQVAVPKIARLQRRNLRRDSRQITAGPMEGCRAIREHRRAQSRLGRNAPRVRSWLDEAARRLEEQRWPAGKGAEQYDWEPPRVAQGIPDRATRLKMIGNACPPQQYLIGLTAIRIMHDRRTTPVQAP